MLSIFNSRVGVTLTDKIEFTAYHGTCSKHRSSIERLGFSPDRVAHRDDHWLGQGVYFFDIKDLAIWWAHDQSKKKWNRNTSPLVYSCDISVDRDEYLDLDDMKSLDRFLSFCIELIESVNQDDSIEEKPVFTDRKLRALLFDYYKTANNIFVIANTFLKKRTSFAQRRTPAALNLASEIESALDLGYKERQICVSSEKCLGSPVLVYSTAEEVI